MLFSVIVPIHNTEEYVGQCIESVLNQTFRDYELILVDDGSTDTSGSICDHYGSTNEAIQVFHTPNRGASSARNTGMSTATGDYILFLDSDDYIAENALAAASVFISAHRDVDLLTCAHFRVDPAGRRKPAPLPAETSTSTISRADFLEAIHSGSRGYWSPWENFFRRDVVESESVRFCQNLKLGEDADFFYRFVRVASRFGFLDTPIVNYRVNRDGSALHQRSREGLRDIMEVFRQQFYYALGSEDDSWRSSTSYFANMYANAVLLFSSAPGGQLLCRTDHISQFDPVIIQATRGLKYKFAASVWKVFGYCAGSMVLQRLRRAIPGRPVRRSHPAPKVASAPSTEEIFASSPNSSAPLHSAGDSPLRHINYVGYYDTPDNSDEARSYTPSATTKMDYICSVLNDAGWRVQIVSMSPTSARRAVPGKVTQLNDVTSLKLFPSLPWGNVLLRALRFISARVMLFSFLIRSCGRGEQVIVYHTTPMQTVVWAARRLKGFRLILEVEEIFQDVRPLGLWSRFFEFAVFRAADSYILSTESLSPRVNSQNKPFVAVHGTYRIEPTRGNAFKDGRIHVIYAGTLATQKKGAAAAVEAARHLDSRYRVHIIGFGSAEEVEALQRRIFDVNARTTCVVSYDGVLQGEEYITFLQKCDIGVALQDVDSSFNASSFPSKILSYLSNGLVVVSTRIPTVEHSGVGSAITFCDSNHPDEVARAIQSVDLAAHPCGHKVLADLDQRFRRELPKVLAFDPRSLPPA